jgi:hypothetical protein
VSDRLPAEKDPRTRLSPTEVVVTGILLVAIIVPLLVPTYDQKEPRLFGFPFFYWYQLLWVLLCAALCAPLKPDADDAQEAKSRRQGRGHAVRVHEQGQSGAQRKSGWAERPHGLDADPSPTSATQASRPPSPRSGRSTELTGALLAPVVADWAAAMITSEEQAHG